jgi:hypothetical protein
MPGTRPGMTGFAMQAAQLRSASTVRTQDDINVAAASRLDALREPSSFLKIVFHLTGRNVMARKYSKKASAKVGRAMKKRKAGTLKSGRSGRKVKSRKQAIAIGLSEARREGKKVPKKGAKKGSKKKTAKKRKAKS